MFSKGTVTVARVRGVPIRIHWTVLLAAFAFNHFSFAPVKWVATVLLILLHELGHAAVVRAYGLHVVAITLHGVGGVCLWEGEATKKQRAVIAWGGVAAQAALLVVALVALALTGPPRAPWLAEVVEVVTSVNAFLIAFNLVPIPPLDGARAWHLLPILATERRARLADRRRRPRAAERAGVGRASSWERASESAAPRPPATPEAHEAYDPALNEADPPPMPAEVEAVLDRILDEVRHEQRAKRERSRS